mmetsp:Transcript_63239/g.184788  ORF Transcript_63239/g.184788 Transcript_63239/m.184788 type:complete len:466 (+) Transcript_63239:110-1507(+)
MSVDSQPQQLCLKERLCHLEERFARLEAGLPSLNARMKTLERNAPLETRLRALEQTLTNNSTSDSTRLPGLLSWFPSLLQRARQPRGACDSCPGNDSSAQRVQSRKPASRADLAASGVSSVTSATSAICWLLQPSVRMFLPLPPGRCRRWVPIGMTQVLSSPDGSAQQPLSIADLSDVEAISARGSKAVVQRLHREAVARGLDTYVDPESGYEVFTASYLGSRACCGSGCRHCPWGHRNVPKGVPKTEMARRDVPKSTLYTRKGDSGWSSLYNEEWVLKSIPVYEAIGGVDELNSAIGLAHELLQGGSELGQQLQVVQGWLLDVGSALCTPRHSTSNLRKLQRTSRLSSEIVTGLEGWIDDLDERLRLLRHFILPGGSKGSAALHLARAICRRAERHTWPLVKEGHADQIIGIFLNRLSDYLFVAARLDAQLAGGNEQEYRIEYKVDKWQRQIGRAAEGDPGCAS